MAKIIFLNQDKVRRAKDIFLLFQNKRPSEPMSTEHALNLKEKFSEWFKENKIDPKDEEAVTAFAYEKLGGATRTDEEMKKIKAKGNISKGKEKKEAMDDEEDGIDADEDDEDDE